MKEFKTIVSVGGRFHAFDLAGQLFKNNCLELLITSYPKFMAKKWGLPASKIKSILAKELFERAWEKLPGVLKNLYDPRFRILELYDRRASRKILPCDIFTGFAGFSLHSLRVAKKFGATTVLERGSSHILYQENILKEEYEKFGVKTRSTHPGLMEKELREYKEADYISTPSSFTKRTFLEAGFSKEKLITVPYGVNLSQFKQITKNDDVFRVIFAGGMSIRKGVHYLLQAFSELKLPNSELLLIGSMNDEIKPFFKKYEGNFRYIGHVPQGELYKYYSQGSVFAIMSIEEGLALVQPQAMACGLPVICTVNTGGEDIARDGKDGFVIPIRDTEKLKEKLVYLYKNPDIRKMMGDSAKERVSSGFTWGDYGEKIIKEYARILKNRI